MLQPDLPRRVDGALLLSIYLVALLIIPARLVISRLPMALTPSMVIAAGIAVACLCAQFTNSLGMAKGRNPVRTVLVVWLAVNLLTYAVATRRFLPPDELSGADNGIIRVATTVGVAFAVCDAVCGRERLDAVLKTLLVCSTIVAGVGFLQFAIDVDLVPYLNLPGLTAQTNFAYILQRGAFRRPSGQTNHPIEFGMVCALAVPLAMRFALRARDRGEPSGRWWFSLGLVALGALTSLSRTAILGLLMAALILVPTLPGRRKVVAGAVGAAFFGVAGLAVPGLLGTLYNLFANIESDPSVTSRTDDYAHVGIEIAAHPLLGRGFGTYFPDKYILLDNQYLLTIIETGYVGLAALIVLFVVAVGTGLACRRLAVSQDDRANAWSLVAAIMIAVVGAATFDLFSFGVATGMLFVLIGALGAMLRTLKAERAELGLPLWSPRQVIRNRLDAVLATSGRTTVDSNPSAVS